MKRVVVLTTALFGALALAACGNRAELKPAATASLPVAPEGAKATPSPGDLLKPPVQTRPARSDDLIESTSQRRSDNFDLPPR
ncbi:hypothetical protein P6144_08915 [Sphingomonas sp. HITSZ_GF]|uniref:hypothetical protein n=1 Tax=Sphingomonas sp. HITSZ_GF TaxID=3037247 RepID=UPI00240E7E72|nr:hypothetical protein [Sphingomonas sp. HITSZ_GF]MDG2533765.1 hypothetical protein [Sphingomonas sp. HITSZ_GF]